MQPLQLFLGLTLLTTTAAAQTWSDYPLKPNDWYHYTASTASQGGEYQIFVFGGSTETTIESDVFRYHRTTFWHGPLAPMPAPRDRATSATAFNGFEERVYVFGGRGPGSTTNDNVWAYDPVADVWETGLTPMPTARQDACAVTADDGYIYVFGGRDGATALKTVERYDPYSDSWDTFEDMAVPRYSFGAAMACDNFLYIFGGETGSGQTDLVEIFNPGGGFLPVNQSTGDPCEPMLDVRADFGCATGRNGRIYIVGGLIDSPVGTASVQAYNPWTNTWSYEPDLPTSRSSLEAVGLGARIWALGGYRKIWPTTAKLEAFGPLAEYSACGDIVHAFPPKPWGDISSCAQAGVLEHDGTVDEVELDGSTPAYLEFRLEAGESVEFLMKNHDGDETTRCSLQSSCGGAYVAASEATGVSGEQRLDYKNPSLAPADYVLELSWPGSPAQHLIVDLSLRRNRDTLGTSYCNPAVPNSSGQAGSISAAGDTKVADNDFSLSATDLPTNKLGYFIVSRTQGFVANPGGSQGNLCLGGKIGRYTQGAASTGSTGTLELDVDLFEIPGTPKTAVEPGDSLNFQAWFRDKNPHSTSNFTNAVSVTFE